MKWLPSILAALFVLTAAPAMAQAPYTAELGYSVGISPGDVSATPEMWFYEQHLRQYQDPAVAVRRKAELRSAQRRARLASQRWYGITNSRPTAGTDPFHGDYSPTWTGGNVYHPFRWTHRGPVAITVLNDSTTTTR